MIEYVCRELDATTWDAFSDLIAKNNGIWGGCWCMAFHEEGIGKHKSAEQNRLEKEARVHDGRAHAALVFHGDTVVGWCQYGRSDEVCLKHKFKKTYYPGMQLEPDWRITCFFVDRKHRGKGVASRALSAALLSIAAAGGGVVEAYPEDLDGRAFSSSFIYLGTTSMFEKLGFERSRQVAKHHWVMTKQVEASPPHQ